MRLPPLSPPAVALWLWAAACARPDGPERASSANQTLLTATRLTPLVATDAVERGSSHLLVTLRLGPGEATVLDARTVDLPLPRERTPSPERWRVLVEGKGGRPLYLAQLRAPAPARAEVAQPDGTLVPVHAPPPSTQTIAVRLPRLRGAVALRVFGPAGSLPPEDPRGRGAHPEAMVEMGRLPFPAAEPR